MQVNAFVTERQQQRLISEERLPARTAFLAIFMLSLLAWAPILLPFFAHFNG